MVLARTEDVFISLLRSVYNSTARHPTLPSLPMRPLTRIKPCRRHVQGRGFATTCVRHAKAREIAVLGAGITGLTTAHYLARHAQDTRITIYEASSRPGGWINAEKVPVEVDGQKRHVLFQYGPSMLRSGKAQIKYDDLVLYDVLASLNIYDLVRVPRYQSARRYIYYPDHLVKLPTNVKEALQSFLSEPIWEGAIMSLLNYWVRKVERTVKKADDPKLDSPDQSIAQFFERALGDDRMVKNLVSAIVHGVYGGDVNKLSMKHTMFDRVMNNFDAPLPGSAHVPIRDIYLVKDMLNGPNNIKVIELAEKAIDSDLMTFDGSLMPLVDALVADLKTRKNVVFRYNDPVTALQHANGQVLITTPKSSQPIKYDHVICTLFSKKLAEIARPAHALPSLAETHAVTIMSVNLWYRDPDLIPQGDFGYLIPSSTPDNDEGCLGVLFAAAPHPDGDEPHGSKLTVMLGGHYWDGWAHYPSPEAGIAMAKAIVERQLGISSDEEVVARARLCKDCLPQHYVGHRKRMANAHHELLSAFRGRLTVAGPSYTQPGVVPAMRAGFDAAMRVARRKGQPWFDAAFVARQARKRGHEPNNYIDYWDPKHFRVPMSERPHMDNPLDLVGDSGLEGFTEDECDSFIASNLQSMVFREWSADGSRFRNADGEFLEPSAREYYNANVRRRDDQPPEERPRP